MKFSPVISGYCVQTLLYTIIIIIIRIKVIHSIIYKIYCMTKQSILKKYGNILAEIKWITISPPPWR